jgi:hypothetical protein
MVTAVIWMNGHGWRAGWAMGVLVQLFWVAFGITYGAPTFWFSLIPAAAFAYNWWQHPKRSAKELIRAIRDEYGPGPQGIIRATQVVSYDEFERFRDKWNATHGGLPAWKEGDRDDG